MKLLLPFVSLALLSGSPMGADARLGADTEEQQERRAQAIGDVIAQALDTASDITEMLTGLKSDVDFSDMSDMDGMMGMGGDFDLASMLEKLKNVNHTDIFDRCCPSDDAILPGVTTQYNFSNADSCNCPVRTDDKFAEKWADSCANKLGPKVLSGEDGLDMEDMMEFIEKMMKGKAANYTDIYDRCCSSPDKTNAYDTEEVSPCKCPVRETTQKEKWDEKCETKIAAKAAGDYDEEYDISGGNFDFGEMIDKLATKNSTAVYMNCCESQEGLPETMYDDDVASCKCPVRQDGMFAEKWATKCTETYGPKAMEELSA